MAAIASSTRASLPPLSPATQQPPSIAPRASFARLFRSKGSHETRLGPLPHSTATRRSTIVPPVSAVAESRNPARSFSCSPSTSPPQINDSLHSDNATSLLVIPTLATVTTLSALIAPSAVAAVTGADVSSVAEAAAAAGAAVGTAGDGALASLSQLFLLGALSLADEPSNALSLPTWIIHVASVVEWVVAMALVWQYGAAESRRAWRGLAWAMVPLLMGAMCACTWHFFYNSPQLEGLVVLQSFMTLLGNCTVCFAAFRIYKASTKTAP
ncbi:unnamed protein product [Closterium sp. NIES-65]|nr:unnamed protein product [Closterium sp. NIES-65]